MNKKGFTLIELLAVIVILAVIALIVTPIVTGIIKSAKESANLRSAEGYYVAVKNRLLVDILDNSNKLKDGIYTVAELENMNVEFTGSKPSDGVVTILNGEVVDAELTFGGSKIKLNNNGSATSLNKAKVYGLKWDGNDNYTRLLDASTLTSCVGTDTTECISDFDSAEIYSEIKDVIVDGNAFVYIPKFYIKKVVTGDTWEWYVSKEKKDGNFYLPACFYDEATNKELPYILVGKYNASLDETGTKLKSETNVVPLVSKTINQYRAYALANNIDTVSGYQLMDIHTVDVLQVLFYIEFGTLNSQSIMSGYSSGISPWDTSNIITAVNGNNITLTTGKAASYKVGQLIDVASTSAGRNVATNLKITAINGDVITIEDTIGTERKAAIAVNNIVYNVANINGQTNEVKASSGSIISNTNGKYVMNYRGIENLYGNVWQFIDGINIDNDTSKIYVNKNSKTYASDKIDGDYLAVGYNKFNTEGYVTKMGYDSNNPFVNLPQAVGGSGSTKYGDHYYMNTTAGKRIMLFGGDWSIGPFAGLSAFYLHFGSSYSSFYIGARLLKTAL